MKRRYIKMGKYLRSYLLLLILLPCCVGPEDGLEQFNFSVEKTMSFETEIYSIDDVEFGAFHDSLVYGLDMGRSVVHKFDTKGKLLAHNRFQDGMNEIDLLALGRVYPINKDSVFVIEFGYDNLLLLGGDLKIKESWNIRKLTGANIGIGGSNTQIVNFEYILNEPHITLVASDRNYRTSEKAFFENSFLAVKVNLNTGEFKSLFRYPIESPYREHLFWDSESPYILYFESRYFVTFPMDPNIYIFREGAEDYEVIRYSGKLNKSGGRGVAFGMHQREFLDNHYLEVFHNQNDYYLISNSLMQKAGHKYFVRVARRAINDKNFDYKDLNTFMIKHPGQEYIIQIIDLDKGEKGKIREYKLPKAYKNFLFIDKDGKIYFSRKNDKSEGYFVDVVSWNGDVLE